MILTYMWPDANLGDSLREFKRFFQTQEGTGKFSQTFLSVCKQEAAGLYYFIFFKYLP